METTLDSIRDIKLYQSRTGYRFSVDALLLYSFVNLQRAEKITDLGAGSGIVGLLLAKKYPDSEVALIELQDSLARLAEKNVKLNSLEDRVRVFRCNIRDITADCSPLTAKSFDLVVSNPPFRRPKTGLISPEEERAIARHEIKLKLMELVDAAFHLLRARGRFCLIYHPARLAELVDILKKRKMEPKRMRFVHSNLLSEAKMVMIEAVKEGGAEMKVGSPLYIYNEDGSYTDEMKMIYGCGGIQ